MQKLYNTYLHMCRQLSLVQIGTARRTVELPIMSDSIGKMCMHQCGISQSIRRHMCVYIYISIYVYTYTCEFAISWNGCNIYIICTYTHTYIYAYMFMRYIVSCIYTHIYIYIHMYIHTYTQVNMHRHVCWYE